jgi:5-formyltetrahydrofolate cyclo-ligase
MIEATGDARKAAVRRRIWETLDAQGAVQPAGSFGHIPSFVGAAQAARRLTTIPAWESARVVKANPDRAQHPVRVAALTAGRLLYMAVPRLESVEPFFRLDPAQLPQSTDLDVVASGRGAAESAPRVRVAEMRPVDLVVCGSVAVDRTGARIGKGAGYSDIEVALLVDAGLIGQNTTIVTTVHDLQVVDEELPAERYDFRVHAIVTPTRVIMCPPAAPPRGIDWERVGPDQLAAIPALTQQRRVNRRS